jgi:hypothetical protein
MSWEDWQMTVSISLRGADARTVFAGDAGQRDLSGTRLPLAPRALLRLITDFYREPLGRLALLVSAPLLVYGGGAVFFWFHAIYLGEGGPAISPWVHWFMDSTAGFIGLVPVLAVLIPLAVSLAPPHFPVPGRSPHQTTARYVLLLATLFALVTAPGPVLHDKFLARGTWVADKVTALLGNGRLPTGHVHHIAPAANMSMQVAVAVPTYLALTTVALVAVRMIARYRPSIK